MSVDKPERKFHPLPLGQVLDQSVSPSRVGANGMTACNNVMYRRYGAWAKRPGSTTVYVAIVPANPPPTPAPPAPPNSPAPNPPPHVPPNPPGPRNPVH